MARGIRLDSRGATHPGYPAHGFTQAIVRFLGLDLEMVKETASAEFEALAPRPAYSVPGHDRLVADSWRDADRGLGRTLGRGVPDRRRQVMKWSDTAGSAGDVPREPVAGVH